MDAKQDMPVTARSSRPLTPATSARSSVRQTSAPQSSIKKAWVVADWKHRVPDPGLHGPWPAAGGLHSRQRAQAVEQRKKHIAAEYTHLYDTINHILDRCSKVQQRLGSSSSSTPGSSKLHSPTYISKRSRILFEAPSAAESAVAGSSASKAAAAAAAAVCSTSDPGAARSQTERYQQQVRPATWAGAVDMNPGFSFWLGSPERFAAICRDELFMLPSNGSSPAADNLQSSKNSNICVSGSGNNKSSSAGNKASDNLKHREVLQAGIQQLSGEFYTDMRTARVTQDKQGVIPASWTHK